MLAAERLHQLCPSYIREILAASTDPGMLSLAGGLPAQTLFPMDLLQQATVSALADPAAFQYSRTEGDPLLLEKLAHKFDCSPDNLLVTTGSQQGLDLIARAYLNPGDPVLVESPCYLGTLQVFALAEAQVITVPQTSRGPDLEKLEQLLIKHRPKLFYAVPDFHNPTGVCWSLMTRQRVAELLNRFDTALIEDAPYRSLRFTGAALPMVSELTDATVLRLHSFSKTIAPGLRLGVVEGEPDLLIDFATLTGAARVALGADLAPVYSDDEQLVADILEGSAQSGDPVWRMPLWDPYMSELKSPIADLVNSGSSFGGSITAGLFLKQFVDAKSWAHFDVWAWRKTKYGRPEGAAACGLRAVWAMLQKRYR